MIRKLRMVLPVIPALLLSAMMAHGQTRQQNEVIVSRYDQKSLQDLEKQARGKSELQKQAALLYAQNNGIDVIMHLEDGGYAELQRVDPDGSLIYYRTMNVAAAKSTRTNHLNIGGSTGYNLDGQNMTAWVWDGGLARTTHQEYDGPGGTNRFSIGDGTTTLNYHSAHVTGTIIASGVVAAAKGMAPQAKAKGCEWNSDLAEATNAAAGGMLISNHSYGYNSQLVSDYYFGAYITDSRDWDALLYNAPYYLMVVAAGNDGTTNYNGAPLNPSYPMYDKLTGHSTSKNNMVVANANDANIDNAGNLISVTINTSSSQGPTDDYRIKPDITGNGTAVYSTYESADNAYASITGTSMASPNVTGTLLLLQQHANNVRGSFLRAATLKGVALHTADDAGMTGPDAIFGWGLLNAKRAAEAISQNGNQSIINELTLFQGQTYTFTVEADGINALMASICWTDPAGTATTATNSTIARLVNDLDLRISKSGTTYYPWRLTGVNTNDKGDNIKDNFERVEVSGATGTYTVTVTHKGTLSGGSQNYSLILTGVSATPIVCNPTIPEGLTVTGVASSTATLVWSSVPAATYELRYRVTGTATWTTLPVTGSSATLSGLTPQTPYEAQVSSICPDNSTSGFSASVLFTTTEVQLNYCASASTNVNDEYIGRVQLNMINNASGAQFYSNFTNISTNLDKGAVYTLTVTPTWTGTAYEEGYAAWIDYNKDGDFSDTGEQIFSKAASTTTPISGTFTVPAGATEGSTRLRVSMKYNAIPTACETFTYGEVEDYTVIIGSQGPDTQPPTAPSNLAASNITQTSLTLTWTASTDNVGVVAYDVYQGSTLKLSVTTTTAAITGLTASTAYSFSVKARDAAGNVSPASNVLNVTTLAPPDTQAPTAPTNLTASNITQNSVNLSWTASTDNVGVVAYDVYQGSSLKLSVTTTLAAITGLAASTTYSFSVKARDAAGNVSPASNVVDVTTLPNTITYCTSKGSSTAYEWIQKVQLGTLSNTSGNNGGYGNFTSLTVNLVRGTSTTMIITPGWTGTKYREAYRVWIDYNQDGDFLDTGEQVISVNKTTATSITKSFTIPTTALTGPTRMRVAMKYNASPTSCEIFARGEVEDYTVNITLSANQGYDTGIIDSEASFLKIYPNPVSGQLLQIELTNVLGKEIRIYNLYGRLISRTEFTNVLDIAELPAGMYIIEIITDSKSITRQFIRH